MIHKTQTYTAEQAAKMAKEVGDFDSSPKHLKREILALKRKASILQKDNNVLAEYIKKQDKRIATVEYALAQLGWKQEYNCTQCDRSWKGMIDSTCPVCDSQA